MFCIYDLLVLAGLRFGLLLPQLHGHHVVHHGERVIQHQRILAAVPIPAKAGMGALILKCSGEVNSPSAKVLLRKTLVRRKSVVFCFGRPNRYGTSELGVLFFIRTFPVND